VAFAFKSLARLCSLTAVCLACSSTEGNSPHEAGGSAGSGASETTGGSAGSGTAGTTGGSGNVDGGSAGTGAGGTSGSAGDGTSGTGAGTSAAGSGAAGAGGTSAAGAGGFEAGGSAGAGTGGGTAASGGGAGATSSGPFVLAWQDDFDTLDTSRWQAQTFTFDGNQAQFSTENAAVANGVLTMSLTPAPSGAAKPYLGVELRSAKTLTYGKVSTRMRFAHGSGVVSSLVLFYTPYPNCDWNEIDIEHLGKTTNSSQLNAMVFTGTPNPSCTTSVSPTQDPQVVDLGFNAETDFHNYDIEWTPESVKYFADGVLLRTWTAKISLLKLPETILLTIWASSSADWAGAIASDSAPTSADVDWIKVYDYVPPSAP